MERFLSFHDTWEQADVERDRYAGMLRSLKLTPQKLIEIRKSNGGYAVYLVEAG